MNGLTAREIAEALGLPHKTIKSRLRAAGIDPLSYAGQCAIYPHEALEAVRSTPRPGRPRKDPPEK